MPIQRDQDFGARHTAFARHLGLEVEQELLFRHSAP